MACIVRKRSGLMKHDCPNDNPNVRWAFGCACEYFWCLKHGQKVKSCTGKQRPCHVKLVAVRSATSNATRVTVTPPTGDAQ